MDASFSGSGFVLDPSKCNKLNMNEKRELVYELSKWSEGAAEMLQSWSRKDLLEILCAEMGKERKYTGLTKQKLIEHLMKIVSEKKAGKQVELIISTNQPPPTLHTSAKRQRKTDHPSRLPIATGDFLTNTGIGVIVNQIYCKNIACRAPLSVEDAFCKRCSCCICFNYDDNKDPSIWLFCSSDPPFPGDSCGASCHLECALKHNRTGIMKGVNGTRLDGTFFCVSCGKTNDLLRCWRKQLVIAKDARRVDVLCQRLSLSQKLLSGTEKYQNLHNIVDAAIKKLEAEVGPIDCAHTGMARGIVNRLSSGIEVQKQCCLAIESLDSMLSSSSKLSLKSNSPKFNLNASTMITFEDISSTSLTVAISSEDVSLSEEIVRYRLWCRKLDSAEYSWMPPYELLKPERKFPVSNLMPATEYMFKVAAFIDNKEIGSWEAGIATNAIDLDETKSLAIEGEFVNPNCGSPKTNSSGLSTPSEGDESNNTASYGDLNKLPEDYHESCDEPEIPDQEKSNNCKETSQSQDTYMGTVVSRSEPVVQEETPGHSISALDEEPNITIQQTGSNKDSTNSIDQNLIEDNCKFTCPIGNEMVLASCRHSESVLPVTPSKLEAGKEGSGRNSRGKPGTGSSGLENWFPKPVKELPVGSSTKKKALGKGEEICNKDGSLEGDYEYCVKVIRWLECEGHIETNFRVKFLTWFSLRATPQERRVVNVFVDTLIDDPPSLAGQLVDTFSEGICSKRPAAVPSGFCMKLWH